MHGRFRTCAAVLAVAAGLAAGLAVGLGAAAAPAAGPVRVVATVGMVADVAREVGGACVEVTTMMGPGTDPHLYQASAGDVQAMARADAILYSGLHLEGQLGDVLKRLAARVPTVAVAERAVPEADRILTGDGYGVDPHVWMDVALWARTPAVIAEGLAPLAPDCADDMAARATGYADRLIALDAWIRDSVATVPADKRALVTAHDAFHYFGRAYGVEVIGIQGVSTAAEAGIADIQGVVQTVVSRGIPAIFVESTINPRTVEAVIAAAADAGHELRLGGQLFSDAMGEEGTAEGTYIGMLVHNATAIVEALGGTPAPMPPALGGWAARWGLDEG